MKHFSNENFLNTTVLKFGNLSSLIYVEVPISNEEIYNIALKYFSEIF